MDDNLRQRITAIFERIEGGSTEDMFGLIDRAIEDGDITQDEFDDNEIAICYLFDNRWFSCEGCAWTMPIEEQDERGEWHCRNCMDEEHGDCDD